MPIGINILANRIVKKMKVMHNVDMIEAMKGMHSDMQICLFKYLGNVLKYFNWILNDLMAMQQLFIAF